MKTRVNIALLELLMLSSLFISCNFLVSPMHGRENSNDFDAQIYSLFAYQTLADEVQVSFPWRNKIYNYDDEDQIEEAFLVYSIGKAIPARNVPVPPSVGGIEGYAFTDNVYMYSKTIEGVSEGDEIWFALYPKAESQWFAPLYEKITVRDPANIPTTVGAGPYVPERGFQAYSGGGVDDLDPGVPDTYTIYNDGAYEDFLILRFELPDRVNCTEALLTLPTTSANIGYAHALVFPHVQDWGGNELMNLIDENNASSFTLSSGTVDVTEAVKAAIIYGSDTIAIRGDVGTNESGITFGSESLTISYEQY